MMGAMGTVTSLERPVYGMGQVDRILKLRSGTARRWIDGYERAGKHYKPVVRDETTGDDAVTWGEFVETRLLAEYRDEGIPMIRMRPVVERLRDEFGVHYPLAHFQPLGWPEGRELVAKVQDEVGLDRELYIVLRTGQVAADLSPQAGAFFNAIDWSKDENAVAESVRPLGPGSPIVVHPLRSFGEPVVRSVRTEILAEAVAAGDPPESVAERFELTVGEINAAVSYEAA
jgi:uncharacterized protein (DUF433 family)